LNISFFKIGTILSIFGIIWISIIFFDGDRIAEEFLLESLNSHSVKLEFVGEDIGYYKVFMPKFSGEEVFIQILDSDNNIISEQSVQTKMSIGYFDFDKRGKYSVKITNVSENPINLQIEFGNTNSQNMIPAGFIVLVGVIMIIISSYMKLKNYRIAQPDENIS
jgi:hypothetical protein